MADVHHRPARREHHLRDRRHRQEGALVGGEGLLRHQRALGATALLLAAAAFAGCGGGAHADHAASAPRPTGGYLAAPDLERQLGNAFRTGLYRLAVMSQQTEDAMDLGQRLPTGLVRGVRCASTGARPGGDGVWMWGCDVRWKSVEGRAQRTRYDVRLTRGHCFAAGAAPRRQPHYDITIRTYSEDPLNALVSVRRGC